MVDEHSRTPASPRLDLRRELEARVLVLDGATGTELERRGIDCALPLWSARALVDAPEVVAAIHRDYASAGADILTANTFRTQQRTLDAAGWGARTAELNGIAIELARRAARDHVGRWVAGSVPPLEDCYRPDLTPDDDALAREHGAHCRALAEAGADLLLVETHHTIRELLAACRAAAATGLPYLASVISWRPGRLLSGETLAHALAAIAPLGPSAILANCMPPSAVPELLGELAAHGTPFGVYPNLGAPGAGHDAPRAEETAPEALASLAAGWIDAGARVVGGCCGTRPEHIAALSRVARRR